MDMRFLEGDESALRKEKLILFGASKMGETVYSLLKDGYDIDYFVIMIKINGEKNCVD
ncbi:hypothetical protein JTS96_07685 [Clostridium botulinum]|nr:hypothetical protein [Clostridium botulinum]